MDKISGVAGNCNKASRALLADLIAADCGEGWTLVAGMIGFSGNHTHFWLENGNWAIDCSGPNRRISFRDAQAYRSIMHARGIGFPSAASLE
jgi:hypothetical protein